MIPVLNTIRFLSLLNKSKEKKLHYDLHAYRTHSGQTYNRSLKSDRRKIMLGKDYICLY